MAGELLEAYRRLEHRQYLMMVCMTISTIVTLIVLILYAGLSISSTQSIYHYIGLESNYSSLTVTSSRELASLETAFSSLSVRYNTTEHNLTTRYTKLLYSNYGVNIPARSATIPVTTANYTGPVGTFNTTYLVKYYTYNFSFNAPYPGYILLNATSTGANTESNTTWEIIVSNGRPLENGTLNYHDYQSGTYYQGSYSPMVTKRGTYKIDMNMSQPYSIYAPLPSQSSGSVMVPVTNGTVRVWIINFANRSITSSFSAEYVGFHTG